MKELIARITSHRVFMPAVIAVAALVIGILLAFELSRNLLKVRGPYLIVLTAITLFPIFAFRFFDPHEDARPISGYFVLASIYYILLGSPDFVVFLRMILFERVPPGAFKQLAFGVASFAALAGALNYAVKIWLPDEGIGQRFLAVSILKFLAYAVLHVIYLNLFVAIARDKFGLGSAMS